MHNDDATEAGGPLTRYFDLDRRNATWGGEIRGALATFLTMAYILVANADILAGAGVPRASAIACTALAAGICCILMGLVSNFPVALASGMGLNAVVAFSITSATGSWQAAMGLVVLDGLVVLLLVLCGLREAMLAAIPIDLRRAISAGIGLFIALIGAHNAGLVLHGPSAGPPLQPGKLSDPAVAVALIGLVVTGGLLVRRVRGALLIGIALGTVLAWNSDHFLGSTIGSHWTPSLVRPSFEIAFQADVSAVLHWKFVPLLIALLMVDFFDTLGTISALAEQSNLYDEHRQVPRLKRVLMVDSLSASIGGLLGVSSVTSYIESAAGIAEGARTGAHSVIVGLLFLAAVFLAPLAGIVPPAATAPALILVGFLMCGQMTRINVAQRDTAIPAFITLVMIPYTYSIAHGIGYGFIAYVLIKLLTLRVKDIHPLLAVAAGMFLVYFVFAE